MNTCWNKATYKYMEYLLHIDSFFSLYIIRLEHLSQNAISSKENKDVNVLK